MELLEAAHVGFGRGDGGLFRGRTADGDIGLLLGDGVALEEILITVGGGVGEVEIGLCALEVGLCDLELLVEFGGFDGGHELAGGDLLAEVDEPLLYVAAGAGIDGRVVEGLRVAGQGDL